MSGWVKLHRKLLDWEWFDDHNTFRLFIFLIMKASHKPYRYKGNDFEAGTLITGRVKLSFETGLSERQTRTSLDKLVLTGEVTIKPTNNYSVISITKWDDYQDSDQPKVQRMANERPATRPTDDHYTRRKEERRKEIDTSVSPKKPTPRSVLESVLDGDHAEAALDHRKRLRKPMSVRAAEMMVKSLKGCSDPNAAIDLMIERGWQSINPEWVQNASQSLPSRASQPRRQTAADVLFNLAEEMENAERGEGNREIAGILPAFHNGSTR